MLTIKQFLDKFPVFQDDQDDLAERILATAALKDFRQDTMLYHEGDQCPGIAFVLSGEIRVFKISSSGREITLYDILPGETCILNAACILSRQDYPAHAVTVVDGVLLYLPKTTFMKLMKTHERMRTFIFTIFSRRFAELIELIEEVTFGSLDTRLMEYLVEKSEAGRLHTTHHKIANELGTSREVVTRLLKDFERQGQIETSRKFIKLLQI